MKHASPWPVSPVPGSRLMPSPVCFRFLLRLVDHLLGDVGGDLFVVAEFGFEAATSLRDRSQIGGVALDLGLRRLCLDDRRALDGGHAVNLGALGIEIADHIA